MKLIIYWIKLLLSALSLFCLVLIEVGDKA